MASNTAEMWPNENKEEVMELWDGKLATIQEYIEKNKNSKNTTLFGYLALLNTYTSESYILQSQCQKFLGPPDPIYGGPSFEDRMQPFTCFLSICQIDKQDPEVTIIHTKIAMRSVELLAALHLSRSDTIQSFMIDFAGEPPQQHIVRFIKDVLTNRGNGNTRKAQFSSLIMTINTEENVHKSVSVLLAASGRFIQVSAFPQTLARLFYIKLSDYPRAEHWATEAISRAPNNSYIADTLGQVYKNRMKKRIGQMDFLDIAVKAIGAFQKVVEKAEKEERPEMNGDGLKNISKTFNNRGLFGYIQVANIVFENPPYQFQRENWTEILTGDATNAMQNDTTLNTLPPSHRDLLKNMRQEVEDILHFFDWYRTYSKPDIKTYEPHNVWKDIALCKEHYTTKKVSESTSFPGLLDGLNRGLGTSKGRMDVLNKSIIATPDLETIVHDLKTTYQTDVSDDSVAECYVLANVVLSNKNPNSLHLTPVLHLRTILQNSLMEREKHRSPEFYLLVLLLFWPEEETWGEPDGEKKEQDTEQEQGGSEVPCTWEEECLREDEDGHESETSSDSEDQENTGQNHLNDLLVDLNMNKYALFVKKAFENTYAKYLYGRYLVPLFFLGRGKGLNRWVLKSKLDQILEAFQNARMGGETQSPSEMRKNIDKMWHSGKVWDIDEIQNILLPVQVMAFSHPPDQEAEVTLNFGGKKVTVEVESGYNVSRESPISCYLGFTIKGPLVFPF